MSVTRSVRLPRFNVIFLKVWARSAGAVGCRHKGDDEMSEREYCFTKFFSTCAAHITDLKKLVGEIIGHDEVASHFNDHAAHIPERPIGDPQRQEANRVVVRDERTTN